MDKLKSLFIRNKEIIMYLVFGFSTTVVSWGSYGLFVKTLGMSIEAGSVLSWVCAVIFAYITNKLWVFESKSFKPDTVIREVITFFGSRLITGILEIVAVPLLVKIGLSQTIFGIEGMLSKVIVSVAVVILNYVFSKLLIFKNNSKDNKE